MMLNPEGTQSVFDLEDGLVKSKSTDELLRFTSKDPAVRAMEEFPDCLETIVAGYNMGLQSKPLLAMKWEERWGEKVTDLRQELGVEVIGPHGGQLTVDFSPKTCAAAQGAIGRAMRKYIQANPYSTDHQNLDE